MELDPSTSRLRPQKARLRISYDVSRSILCQQFGIHGQRVLKLIGTFPVKPSEVASLGSDKAYLSETDWEAVLEHVLLQRPLPKSSTLGNISATAAIVGKSLEVTIKTYIGKITKRLGLLSLAKTPDLALDIVHWTDVAASNASELSTRLNQAQSLSESQQKRIQDLEAELESLIAERDEAESTLYSKFVATINTKKLKIRDQQTLLASAKVDPEVAAQVRALRDAVPRGLNAKGKSRAGAGRSTGKRKAGENESTFPEVKDEPLISDESTEEGDSEPEGERIRQLTPSPDESEASDVELARPPLPTPLPTRNAASRSRTVSAESPQASRDVEMQEAVPPALDDGGAGEVDRGYKIDGAKPVAAENMASIVDEDATDDEDDDEL